MTRTEKWKEYRNKAAKISSSDLTRAKKKMSNQIKEKKEDIKLDSFFQDILKELNEEVMFK